MIAFLWNLMRLETTVWFIGLTAICTIYVLADVGRRARR